MVDAAMSLLDQGKESKSGWSPERLAKFRKTMAAKRAAKKQRPTEAKIMESKAAKTARMADAAKAKRKAKRKADRIAAARKAIAARKKARKFVDVIPLDAIGPRPKRRAAPAKAAKPAGPVEGLVVTVRPGDRIRLAVGAVQVTIVAEKA